MNCKTQKKPDGNQALTKITYLDYNTRKRGLTRWMTLLKASYHDLSVN